MTCARKPVTPGAISNGPLRLRRAARKPFDESIRMFETPVHWVAGIGSLRLGLSARPCGGKSLADEVQAWRRVGVAIVVALLERHEIRELDLGEEASLCAAQAIRYIGFAIPDRGLPASRPAFIHLIDELYQALQAGQAVLIHCRAGVGRTGLLGACLLHACGICAEECLPLLIRARGVPMPDTQAQEEWVKAFCVNRQARILA